MVAPERYDQNHAGARALTALARAEYVMRPSRLAGNLAHTVSITFSQSVSDSAAIILPRGSVTWRLQLPELVEIRKGHRNIDSPAVEVC